MNQPSTTSALAITPLRTTVVRRLPVPACEPPYDAAPTSPRPPAPAPAGQATEAIQGALALAFTLPSGVAAVPEPPPDLRLLGRLRALPGIGPDDDWAEPRPTPRSELPEPAGWAGRLAQAVLEVLGGQRPLAQLVRWTSAEVYERLRRRAALERVQQPDQVRSVVRSLSITEPADGVAEVAVLARRGPRCTALALRLEGLDGRWQCTAVELGPAR